MNFANLKRRKDIFLSVSRISNDIISFSSTLGDHEFHESKTVARTDLDFDTPAKVRSPLETNAEISPFRSSSNGGVGGIGVSPARLILPSPSWILHTYLPDLSLYPHGYERTAQES